MIRSKANFEIMNDKSWYKISEKHVLLISNDPTVAGFVSSPLLKSNLARHHPSPVSSDDFTPSSSRTSHWLPTAWNTDSQKVLPKRCSRRKASESTGGTPRPQPQHGAHWAAPPPRGQGQSQTAQRYKGHWQLRVLKPGLPIF